MRTRIKICGLTRAEDAVAAAELGVDAVGLVFYPPSPRAISIEQAQQVIEALPAFVNRVALFVNADRKQIETVLEQVPIDTIQFHGDESAADCEALGMPYLKALRVRSQEQLQQQLTQYQSAAALLLDTYHPNKPGGTGEAFDWQLFPRQSEQKLILAGGLKPENVGAAIAATQPYGVDVSGGVEQAKGVKSKELMSAFVKGVNRVEREN